MNIKNMIYRRKSFRNYSKDFVHTDVMADIDNFIKAAKTLYPDCKFKWSFIGADSIKCVQPWRSPHYIAMFADDTLEARENLGFVFQQAELYMQSIGLGTCWLGLGKLNDEMMSELEVPEGMECLMMMAFGYFENDDYRSDIQEFKRKAITEISDKEDAKLECARVAPSAINCQPWYFVHKDEYIHLYCVSKYLIHKVLGKMNRFDIGIALAHIYVENTDTFSFYKQEEPSKIKGYYYIGSIKI